MGLDGWPYGACGSKWRPGRASLSLCQGAQGLQRVKQLVERTAGCASEHLVRMERSPTLQGRVQIFLGQGWWSVRRWSRRLHREWPRCLLTRIDMVEEGFNGTVLVYMIGQDDKMEAAKEKGRTQGRSGSGREEAVCEGEGHHRWRLLL